MNNRKGPCKCWTGKVELKCASFWTPDKFYSWELLQIALLQKTLQAEHSPLILPKTTQPQETKTTWNKKWLVPGLTEPFIFAVISLAWQGTGRGAEALAGPGRADPRALVLGLSSKAVLNQLPCYKREGWTNWSFTTISWFVPYQSLPWFVSRYV